MIFFTEDSLNLKEMIAEVSGNKFGAVVTFSGCVRDTEDKAPIRSITYEAYTSMADLELKKLVEETENIHGVKIALRHRIGQVPVGEASLVVACAGKHRKETFTACGHVIDEIKRKVPIWKIEFEKPGG